MYLDRSLGTDASESGSEVIEVVPEDAIEADQQQAEGNIAETKALYRRLLTVLDPPNPEYDELRVASESILKSLEAPKPKTRAQAQPIQ